MKVQLPIVILTTRGSSGEGSSVIEVVAFEGLVWINAEDGVADGGGKDGGAENGNQNHCMTALRPCLLRRTKELAL
jgi:hypothetical protein